MTEGDEPAVKEKPYILVADDDPNISRLVALYLEKENFEVRTANRGDDAVNEFSRMPPDLMLLDVMLPGMDGYQVLKAVRKSGDIPVIMLSARTEEYDKLFGFELGVDDYVSKPFSPKKLMARLKVILERGKPADRNTLRFDGLNVDVLGRTVTVDGVRANLTPKEIDLLIYLLSHPNIALSRRTLLQEVWGFDYYGEDRTVDTHIKMLRRNLGRYRDRIVTVHGTG